MKTNQELFDIVWNALNLQGLTSMGSSETGVLLCSYRGSKGRKCAAGHLIEDDEYDPRMEAQTVRQLLNTWNFKNINLENAHFVQMLQNAHDTCMPRNRGTSLEAWRSEMHKLAEMYSLTVPPIPEGAAE